MGGQAFILYGGAEFSSDIDFAILASDENLLQMKTCLDEQYAEVIAVLPSPRNISSGDTRSIFVVGRVRKFYEGLKNLFIRRHNICGYLLLS
jgi:hypothetical protein